MLLHHRTGLIRALPGLCVLAALVADSAPVLAQQAGQTPDGATFQSQSQQTQKDFTGMFGPGCAAQEWAWQHTLDLNADFVDGPAATDGLKLVDQDEDLRLAFVALFGTQANAEWVAERNAFLAHKVLTNTVAPIPCPPAKAVRSPGVIATGQLTAGAQSARNGDFEGSLAGLLKFRTLWGTVRVDVTKRAPGAAQSVQAALDAAILVLADPKAPEPPQTQYFPVMQALLEAVRAANATLAAGPGAGVPAAPGARAPQI